MITPSDTAMNSTFHFISGLPRSGSTLLSAILRQNPAFSASITSPVPLLCGALQQKMSGNTEFSTFFDDERRANLLRGVFDSYYANLSDRRVVFDTNRAWTGKTALIENLYPAARIICCVRDIGWIIDSIERMLVQNPLQLSRIFNYATGTSVYARAEMLMNSDTGLIGQAWSTLREAWFGNAAQHLIVIPYDSLVQEPARVLRQLYEELGEPLFHHDFDHVTYDEPEFDIQLGMPGLHRVDGKVAPRPRSPSIPPDLFTKYAEASFWRRSQLNAREIKIL
jgi:sulfotransferase